MLLAIFAYVSLLKLQRKGKSMGTWFNNCILFPFFLFEREFLRCALSPMHSKGRAMHNNITSP